MQQKSRKTLIKFLSNIGIVGAILAGVVDIVLTILFVVGVQINQQMNASIIFACINAFIGILINVLLRYQGQHYAELENQKTCEKFYKKEAEKKKKFISMSLWQVIKFAQDVILKGITTAFSLVGIIYISIVGSKNPIQILITIANLILFACFGFMGMNSAYNRFYNVQLPYMELKIKEKENEENAAL